MQEAVICVYITNMMRIMSVIHAVQVWMKMKWQDLCRIHFTIVHIFSLMMNIKLSGNRCKACLAAVWHNIFPALLKMHGREYIMLFICLKVQNPVADFFNFRFEGFK